MISARTLTRRYTATTRRGREGRRGSKRSSCWIPVSILALASLFLRCLTTLALLHRRFRGRVEHHPQARKLATSRLSCRVSALTLACILSSPPKASISFRSLARRKGSRAGVSRRSSSTSAAISPRSSSTARARGSPSPRLLSSAPSLTNAKTTSRALRSPRT